MHTSRPSGRALLPALALGVLALGAFALATTPALAGGGPGCRAPGDGLVVHEWGTFTSVTGSDGVGLDWRPLSGPSDLPGFVYGLDLDGNVVGGLRGSADVGFEVPDERRDDPAMQKKMEVVRVRMETPVLYFYADEETEVSVRVNFPRGQVTEWYPQARQVEGGIDWGRFKVLPGARVELPREAGESHYYPARATDAAPVRVCGENGNQHEKFLFYRGIGTFDLPISAELEGDTVRIRRTGKDDVTRVILFENRGGEVGFRTIDELDGPVTVRRSLGTGTLAEIELRLENALVEEGLYRKEARAMLDTWDGDWFEEGLRCFYFVPRRLTDELLPLTMEPKPAELVRVLVGRLEIITPEMEEALLGLVERLDDDEFEVREEATRELQRHGRFAEPILQRALRGADEHELRNRLQQLLRALRAS